jgi:hypothetical protein
MASASIEIRCGFGILKFANCKEQLHLDGTFITSCALSLDGVDYTISVYLISGCFSGFWQCPKCLDQYIAPVPASGSDTAIKLCARLIDRHHAHYHRAQSTV